MFGYRPMQTFIQELAAKIFAEHQNDLSQLEVVFPNRRAGLFFNKALGKLIDKPIWMPRVRGLEDFVLAQSPYEKIETLEAVFLLYESYRRNFPSAESFDKFFFWGEMILRDFEDIDHYLVDADKLFTSIKTQKELDEEFYFLDEEDKKIIQTFWSTFLPKMSKNQEAFFQTWKILKPVYHDFRKELTQKLKAYNGLIYRDFLGRLKEGEVNEGRKVVFAGFNALTAAEEGIISYYVEEKNAEIYWDLDAYFMDDPNQEAGFFLRKYRDHRVLGKSFSKDLPTGLSQTKKMEATGVSLEVGQAKAMSETLEEMMAEKGFDPMETVIVLPKEHMLFPTLHALPKSIDSINITMGFPMKDTVVYSLIDNLLQLQNTRRDSVVHGASFYHKPVVEILEHPLIAEQDQLLDLVEEIKKRNLIFIYQDEVPATNKLIKAIFSKPGNPLNYIQVILKHLYELHGERQGSFEIEFISRFYEQVEKLREMMGDRGDGLSYDFLIKLFRRVSRSLKIPFTGEPLNGLQIMGVLETRNLDFKNVLILNMNEESWPAPPRRGSFIPYNIRRAFQLPVFEHQDAIYSYLFYRLLQRAENVHFYYNTVSEFNVNGELSRLVQQLDFESDHEIKKRILANPIRISPRSAIEIKKDSYVLNKLSRFIPKTGAKYSRLAPSALNTYLDCRLKFYFRYAEELYEPDELQEELDPMVFGNILHDAMEIIYADFMKKQKREIVEPNDFFWLENGIKGAINKAFISHYKVKNEGKFKLEGRNIIAGRIIEKTIRQILRFDSQYAPFKIIGLETSSRDGYTIDYPIEVNGKKITVGLKGKIDRIDLKQGRIRVIDYKTGKDNKEFKSVPSLIDREDIKRNKAVFQVFFYSYLFANTSKMSYQFIEPGLFNSRDLFRDEFQWQVMQKDREGDSLVGDFRRFQDEFEDVLKLLLEEIWDPSVPFDQVEDEKNCKFCAYKEICGRGY